MNLIGREIVFIAGGGKYGSGALKHFLEERPDWKVAVCDENRDCQASTLLHNVVNLSQLESSLRHEDRILLVGDAAKSIVSFYSFGIAPKMIIPCVPFHLAARVLTAYMTARGLRVRPYFEPLKLAYEKAQPEESEYVLYPDNALVVSSKMPFDLQCTSGCTQPQECPVTGRKLLRPMYELMAERLGYGKVDFVKVLRSRLLAPNVGGFSGEELKQTLELCVQEEPCTIAIATSCSCHAVANIFKIGH